MEGERNGESIPLVQLSEEDRQNEDNMQVNELGLGDSQLYGHSSCTAF